MKRAQVRDAVNREKFYFRKSLVPEDDDEEEEAGGDSSGSHDHMPKSHDNEYTLMSIDTIVNGKVSLLSPSSSLPPSFPPLPPTLPSRMNFLD